MKIYYMLSNKNFKNNNIYKSYHSILDNYIYDSLIDCILDNSFDSNIHIVECNDNDIYKYEDYFHNIYMRTTKFKYICKCNNAKIELCIVENWENLSGIERFNLVKLRGFTNFLIELYFDQIKNDNRLISQTLTNPNISFKHIDKILEHKKEIADSIAYNKNPKIIMKYFNRFIEFHKKTIFKNNIKYPYKFYKFVWDNCSKTVKEAMLSSRNISKKFVLEHKDEFREYDIDYNDASILKILDYNNHVKN